MKNKPVNKTLGVKTGKDILNLFKSKVKNNNALNGNAPGNETETGLFAIWAGLLGHENFGIHDDFFQVGGNSLKGIQVISRISKQFQVNIQLTDIFLNPTIAGLSILINEQQKSIIPSSGFVLQPRPELIPLSFSQERLWFIDQLEGTVQYHLPAVLRLTGKLDRAALEHTLQTIVNRHEVLRTVFRHRDGKTWQHIKEKNGWKLSLPDGPQYNENPEDLQHTIDELIKKPFDLSKDDMIRASLISSSEEEHLLVVVMHHIASDGWSISVLVKEVIELYNSYIDGQPASLETLEIQYADFAIWQRNYLQGELLDLKLSYWKEKLQGVSPLELSTDFLRPAVWSSRGAMARFNIDAKLSEQLQLLSQEQGTTLFMTLLAALKVLLHRYTGQRDICVGSGIAGRQHQEVENLIGFFVNTLALRSDVSGEEPFSDLLQQVKATTLGAYENQEVPFEKVVDAIVTQRDMSRNPLFQVMFVLQNTPGVPVLKLGEVELSRETYQHTTAQFDLSFSITETASGLEGELEYCTDLYSALTIGRMLDHYKQLLGSIVKEPHQLVGSFEILSEEERNHLVFDFNNRNSNYPAGKSIIDLFEEQVSKTPSDTAIVFEDQRFIYKELSERSNQLAHYLRSRGVKAGTLVPICVERSLDMMVGILGILKAGAVYVPLDPKYPAERISFMLADTDATVAVSSRECSSKLNAAGPLSRIELDGDWSLISEQPKENLNISISASDLAYIIYTSGSTGTPKGVMVEHRNVVSLVRGVDYISLDKNDVLLSTGSFSFDATTVEYWGMLLNGGQLIICPETTLLSSTLLKEEIANRKVTKMWFTSSWFNQLVETDITLFEGLQTVLVGGEKLSEKHIEQIRATYPSIEIINGYGPTENTTFSLTYNIRETRFNSAIPIGRPLNNRTAYILNAQHQPVPIGVAGEICLGGAGLSRGYLKREELTKEKFITSPFDSGTRLYRTGDLGRWLPDGNIEYLGRLDDQVKIRGFRIELGEIESVLGQSGLVRQAVVVVKEDRERNKRLAAYIVAEGTFNREQIVANLKDKLPDYMIPSLWVELEQLPLTPNGKVDKRALPEPDANEVFRTGYTAPRTKTEEKIEEIWKDLLGLQRIGIYDNFFELGGHSLLAMRLISAIRKELMVEITIKDLFVNPTIADLSSYLGLEKDQHSLFPSIKKGTRPDLIPLSFSQERLWFIDLLEGSVQYHLPIVLRLKGSLNITALTNALQHVINRHEALRTVIRTEEGQGYQYIQPKDCWQLSITDSFVYNADTNQLEQYIRQLINTPFDLSKDYMVRGHLIRIDENENVLVLTMHHIASDAWSVPIMVEEVISLYTSFARNKQIELTPLPVQYADYSLWQRSYLNGEILDKKLQYWREKLDGLTPLQLPTDHARPAVLSTKGAITEFNIDKKLSEQLHVLAKEHCATMFMTLLTALKVLLSRYSGQKDICVGSPVANRRQKEVESLIGFFINSLALRSDLDNNPTFRDLLQQVKTTTLEAYEHQDVPFEKVVDAVVKDRDMSRSPLFQVMFVLENRPAVPALSLEGIQLFQEKFSSDTAKFELTLNIVETSAGLSGSIEYSTDLYHAKTIERMVGHFIKLLNAIVHAPSEKISTLSILTQPEEQQLLHLFNKTGIGYPKDRTILDLFERQVADKPISTAIIFENRKLRYKELNERSNQLAHYLRSKDVREESLVPICIERGLDMIVGLLGILKAGAAYVPIDPEYPEDRISYMLEDTAALIVVSSEESKTRIADSNNFEIVSIDGAWPLISKESTDKVNVTVRPENLAYVIYTSGSTGKPKGVLIEHRNVVRLFETDSPLYHFTGNDVWTMFHSFCFDFSVWEIYGALFYGGRVVIVPKEATRDVELFSDLLIDQNVTILNQTPSAFYVLQDHLIEKANSIPVRYVIFGGEALNPSRLQPWKELYPACSLINMYGITETTVHVTYQEIEWQHIKGSRSIIGKPIPTLTAYILDRDQNLLPSGVAGELHIGGAGLARGYLNRPELTRERFIKDPFSNEEDARLYRTGDLARWLPDGNLEYLGRIDEQVKIRGYRIELGEIESVLHECTLVSQAVVLAKPDKEGSKRLVGYVVPEGIFQREAIVSYLKGKLPDYMVPALWVELERFPLTSNGKINKKALPDPDASGLIKNEYVAPVTEEEQVLARIWQEVLSVERVGIYDNFFELGGDSIKVIRVVHKLKKLFNKEIRVFDIYHTATLSELAQIIHAAAESNASAILDSIKHDLALLKQNIIGLIPDADLIEDIYPMSDIQSGMVYAALLNPELAIYHDQFTYYLSKDLNTCVFEKAISLLIDKHSILRTAFNLDIHSEGMQIVYKSVPFKIEFIDLEHAGEEDGRRYIEQYLEKERARPFEVNKVPVWRAAIIKLKEHNAFIFQVHHALLDGWSVASFNTELNNLYFSLLANQQVVSVTPLKASYKDFIIESIADKQNEENNNFWLHEMSGYKRLNIFSQEPVSQKLNKTYPVELLDLLTRRTKQDGISLKGLFFGAYLYSLSMLTPEDEITVGLVSNTRPVMEDGDKLLGCFLNTIPCRIRTQNKNSKWKTYFEAIEEKLVALKQRDRTTLLQITSITGEKAYNENPFFDALFSFTNFHVYNEFEKGLINPYASTDEDNVFEEDSDDLSTNTYLNFLILLTGNVLKVHYRLQQKLKSGKTLQELNQYFDKVIECYLNRYDEQIDRNSIITKTEHQLLAEVNSLRVDYPKNKTIVDLFEEQVMQSPEATAIVFEGQRLSYRQLNQRSNQLAHYLRTKGVKEESLVPICIERSADMFVGVMGILKAGAAYVPIDTDFPADRISYMMEDTQASVVISSGESRSKIESFENADIIEMDNDWPAIAMHSMENVETDLQPDNLAYVIYTSGSTGKPKGVMIGHRNLVDYVFGLEYKTQIKQCRSFALVSTIATDLGNTVIYGSLFSGGVLHLFSKDATSDVEMLHEYFENHKIDCLKIVPSHWRALCTEDNLLLPAKLLVFGGEALPAELVERIWASGSACRVVNHYGPTETTIGKLLHVTEPGRKYGNTIPIGKPFSNAQVYVVNTELELCPIGVPGQLYISGDGVARGYFNNSELTNQKFIKNPFDTRGRSVMYGTGDLVRHLADGNIEFIGRVDDQVKIRGYRIELGEIETALQLSELVSQAVVLAREDKQGNKRLIAYIVPDGSFDREGIIAFLKDKLPEYMIPALIVELDSLPLTANGKVDKKALPDPDVSELISNDYAAPRNEAEQALVEIWQELLDVERIGIHDNFFELGGDSIITIQVVSRARREGYELQIGDVFTYQTIARLSSLLEQRSNASVSSSGEQFLLSGASGLLPVQQWYFEKKPEEISHFNQCILLGIDKAVTESVLKRAIEELSSHHDALRFKYYKKDGSWHQVYDYELKSVTVENLQAVPDSLLSSTITESADRFQRSLDIEKGDLVRVVLMQTPASETANRLLIAIHHLAVDGVSWRILLEDLEHLITGILGGGKTDLGAKSSSYRQWYEALEKYGQSERLSSQKNFWENIVKNYSGLPVDKQYDGAVRVKDTHHHGMRLGAIETKQLIHDVPRVYHTEINDILIATLALTLAKWSGQNKVVIGMEGHGRESIDEVTDTSRTVGWFTTHYPVMVEVPFGENADHLIKSLKEQLRQVPDKGLGYGVLKYINKQEALLNAQDPDILFNYLGQADNVLSSGKWLSVSQESAGSDRSELYALSNKISVNGMVQGGELTLDWTYSGNHYEKDTIKELVQNYLSNLQSIISHCIEQQKKGVVFTPSDYGLGSEISYTELDRFLEESWKGKPRKESIESLYRLSGLQQGMLFHGLYDEGGAGYVNHFWCDLIIPDLDILNRSWNYVLKRHSILRSGFYHDYFSVPLQAVYREAKLPIRIIDYRDMSGEEQLKAIKRFEESDRGMGFDFKTPPLMRISLLQLDEQRYRMLWSSHHILFDGWSRAILMEEFLKIYELLVSGKTVTASEVDQYEDYIRFIERIEKEKEKKYWSDYLKEVDQSTLLPFIGTTAERNKGFGLYKSLHLNISPELSAEIEKYGQLHRITMNTIMQGIWAYLLHRYTGTDNIVYGVIVSGRPDDLIGVERRVGMYINTLPLHATFRDEQQISSWLQGLQEEQVSSRQYQYTSLNEIQGWSAVKGDLFDSLFVFENYPISKVLGSGQWKLQVENVQVIEQTNYPLNIVVTAGESINVEFIYNTELLKEEYLQVIGNHFEHVLSQLIEKGEGVLSDIELLTKSEEAQLLNDLNNTSVEYDKTKTIVNLFEEQVEKTPGSIAVAYEGQQLTYKELNERSNQLAHYLRSKGVKEETLVPICLERSLEMIIGILGILKAGGAYVPIDPEYPEERIGYMLADINAAITITSKVSSSSLHFAKNLQLISLDTEWNSIGSYPTSNPSTVLAPENLAYVIYTSGSTGKPKGVMNEHRGLVNRLCWAQEYYQLTGNDSVLQKTTFCFDVSVWELLWPLLAGSKLVFAKPEGHKDPEYLKSIIDSQNITMMHFVPSMLGIFLSDVQKEECKGLKKVLCSGEALKQSQVEQFIEKLPHAELHNLYGPTEAAIDVTYWSLSDRQKKIQVVPIGKPVANTSIHILDKKGSLVPMGCIGEINIAGVQVARGYLNRPELTAEKFVRDPFSKTATGRMYRTGDLGRWLPDGNIEYLGRIDEQVKIRGFRIELGEIEACMAAEPGVKNARVIVTENNPEIGKQLNAYLEIDKERLPLLANYLQLLNTKKIQKSDLNMLPNGLPVLGANSNEVKFLYDEIFKDLSYLKHGITLNENSCVIDIGANIGFFTVFLNILSENIRVYSVEPIPEVYNYLVANRELYNIKGKAFQLALLDKEQEIDFVYYPQMTILSGISEDRDKVKDVVRSYVEKSEQEVLLTEDMDSLLEMKLESRKINVKAKTLSQIIAEEKIETVDLLKVDVENSEHLVIAGLLDKDWNKIQSIIIEVHDQDGRLDKIKCLLEEKGFEAHVEKENVLSKDDILYNIYALRKRQANGLNGLVEQETSRKRGWEHPLDLAKNITNGIERKLPEYMIPAHTILLDKFPLTPNGKIDKNALPDPGTAESGINEYKAPQTETEKILVRIWQELLKKDRIGIHDDFFALGGHSLLAMRVISSVRKELEIEIVIKALFLYPTIQQLAEYLDEQSRGLLLPAITSQPRTGHIPLSYSQERLWFIDRLEGSLHYHLPSVLRFRGILNKEALSNAIQHIINRHEILRTVIIEEDGTGFQHIREKNLWQINIEDGSSFNGNDESLKRHIHQLIKKPFDLSRDYKLRADLIGLNDSDHMLVVTMHHIAADGWSVSIIVKELVELYSAYEANRPARLATLDIQYADYAIWQRRYLRGEVLDKKIKYWKERLQGISTLQLPTDFPRPAVQSIRGARTTFLIDKEVSEKLHALSQQQGVTLFMTLLTAFKIMLHKYSGQDEICVGTPVANRTQHEVESLIGFFINTLALRSDLSNNPSFTDLLQKVKATTLEAYTHQEVPFEKVVEAVVTERDMSRNPIFQVLLTLQNTPEVPELALNNVSLSIEDTEHTTSQLDIICNVTETDQGMVGSVEYCTDLYTEQTINRMMHHFKQLLYSVIEAPQQRIAALQMLTVGERMQLIKNFNDTAVDYDDRKTIIGLFEEQVSKNADHISAVFEDQQLTFQQLNERANQLAGYLRSKGVKEETLVPVCIERSLEMPVAILGILKAGAAYVPIDPEYPSDRIRYMLEDTGATIAICTGNTISRLNGETELDLIVMDDDWSFISLQPSINHSFNIQPNHLAYIIYTSGSTGKPKGVMIEHGQLYSYLLNNKTRYISADKNITGSFIHLSYTFDASLTGLFMPLLFGKSVVIGSKQSFDVFEDSNLEKYAPYDFIKITPSHLDLLQPKMRTDYGSLLTRKLVIGGEALFMSQFNYLIEEGLNVEIINEYGPTEATVGCSVYSFKTLDNHQQMKNEVSIGRPIDNVQMYILNSHLELLPVGVPGEIYIAGAGVARGYLNRPELTSERFVTNPFSTQWGGRMYKTGDLARWSSDGNIEYLGRVDDQVKIRGYRIELGEIESVIQQIEQVRQAVVLAKADSAGNKKLVAYIVPNDEFDKDSIISYLKEKLPEYMVPALWVEMETLPLTSNGKVDKKALPYPEASENTNTEYAAPRDITEQALVEIWQELLDVERVGIHDNFFDLGGDSIIIIQIVSRARRAGIDFQVSDVFTHQTISKLSAVISQKAGNLLNSDGEQGLLTGASGLLPIQQWYFESERQDISHFNQSVLLNINKEITEKELADSFHQLITHHDALRFIYNQKESLWQQEYGTYKSVLHIEDCSLASEDSLSNVITTKANEYQRSLDIEKGELVKVVLVQTPPTESKNRLLIIIHHLAVDGISWRILLEDLELSLSALKNGTQSGIGSKTSSYRQWLEALNKYGESKRLLSQKSYWTNTINKYKPLFADKDYNGLIKVKDIGHQLVNLEADKTQMLLQEVPGVYHTEINDLLLSALGKTLCNWVKTDGIVIGLEGHGREQIAKGIDISRTIGWFTSMYPVLLDLSSAKGPGETIKEVKEQLRQIPDKGLGFGVLKYLTKEKKFASSQHWDIVFNYFGQLDNVVENGKWLGAAKESRGAGISEKHPVRELISINAMIQGGELVLDWGYSKLHFNEETITALTTEYKSNLELLIAHCVAKGKSGTVYTPSDYGLGSEITNAELDAFLDEPYKNTTRRESIEGLYRLSGLQQGMLFHGLYDRRAGAYIEQLGCDLKKPDLKAFRKSWENLLKRHTILRSGFYHDAFNVPVQCVYKNVEVPLEILDFRGVSEEEQAKAIKRYEASDLALGFDFASVPLMRIALIRLSEDRYRMFWTSHHILFDGWSIPVLMEEFLSTYELLVEGKNVINTEEDKYEDYIRYIERTDKEQEEIYWRNYLKDITQGTLLPFIRTTADRTKGVGLYRSLSIKFSTETTTRAERFAQLHRVTVNTLIQGIWSYLLHTYTGNNDVVYGVIVSGRPEDLPGVEHRVGMYINTLPLHSNIQKEQSIVQWLQGIQEYQVSSRQYQYTPLHHIQAWTGVKGDLFDSLLVVENYPVSKVIGAGKWSLEVENLQINEQTNYPLSILVAIAEQISVRFSYNTELLKDEYVLEISRHFEHVLLQILDKATGKIGDINVLTPAEQQQLLLDFNNTKTIYPKDNNIVSLFEEQAAKTPENIALVFNNEQLTYQELNERANKIAHYLRSRGVAHETLVPICMERNPMMIAGMLGILKAGAAYVPIDPEYPEERISYMLEDTAAAFVIASHESRIKLHAKDNVEILEIDGGWASIHEQPANNVRMTIAPEQLAYVIYTSGSTGKPKGVMIEHRNAYTFVCWSREEFMSSRFEIVYASTSICFDLSIFEIFYPLSIGKPIRLLENGLHIADYLSTDRFVLTNSVPVVIENLLKDGVDLSHISVINMAGEPIPSSVQQGLNPDKIEVRNLYGPTEDTTYSTVYRFKKDEPLSIGKPISNTYVYIINNKTELVPVGVAGEICIAGEGLARGYLNRPELTSEKFVPNLFSRENSARLYRTGDLGRWLPDGNIEYLGRIDEQVKIRGYRIELGEIETVLQQSDLVSQAVVLAKADKQGQKRLVGYVVHKGSFDRQSIMDYLRNKLPEFMIPALWMELASMPLTPNGKIDKKALPDPDVTGLLANEYVAPQNELEQQLTTIWQDLLHLEKVGVRDNFFELGGHSLLVIRLLSAIRKELKVEVAINTFFELATIEGLSNYIKVNQQNFKSKIEGYDTIKL
jgi:amino acid adenylation domain-containing protein/non-ribosomal peptide synthase protein (TIGR01720 family)/FkbM family methyltransferase